MWFLGTFETNSTGQFTSASGSVQSSVVKEGTYAGLNGDNHNFLKNIYTDYGITDRPKIYAGAWFRWTGAIADGWFVMLGDGGSSLQWDLKTLTGSKLKLTVNGITYNGSTVLAINTWYFIMVEFYCHNSAGYAKVFVNGALDITTGTIDSKSGVDDGVVQIKWQGTNSASVNCYVDDCLFSDYDPNFGIKVSKSGQDISCIDPKNLDFSSGNFFLKFHDQQNTSVTFNGGDTDKSVTISHSLGYVPAFRAFFDYDGKTYMIPSIPVGVGFNQWAYAYATSTGITVGFKMATAYNTITLPIYEYFDSYIGDGQQWISGNVAGTGVGGAFRFVSVPLNRSEGISSASINARITATGSSNSDTRFTVYGIDEDNTGGFGSDPMGRSRTTATYNQSQSKTTTPYNTGINVKTCLEEIIDRAGWSSGNAIGFLTLDNGSPNDAYIGSDSTSTQLEITKSGTLTIPFRVIIFKDKIAD